MFHRVGPGQIVEPGPGSDIPEDSTPVDVTRFRRSVDVVDEFVVIGGIVGRHVAVPFREVAAAVEEVLVVLPDPDDGGGLVYNPGRVVSGQADLVEPFGRGVIATGFVEPVAIEDGEVDLVADLGIQGVKDGESRSHAVAAAFWVVATGELEAEVEQSLRVARRVPVILCPRHGAERSLQLVIRDPVVVTGIGRKLFDREESGVVVLGSPCAEGKGTVEFSGLPPVEDLDLAFSLGPDPQGHGVWGRPSQDWPLGDANGSGSGVLGKGLRAEAENGEGR